MYPPIKSKQCEVQNTLLCMRVYAFTQVCTDWGNLRVILETADSSQTKLIGKNLHTRDYRLGNLNLTFAKKILRGDFDLTFMAH